MEGVRGRTEVPPEREPAGKDCSCHKSLWYEKGRLQNLCAGEERPDNPHPVYRLFQGRRVRGDELLSLSHLCHTVRDFGPAGPHLPGGEFPKDAERLGRDSVWLRSCGHCHGGAYQQKI